MDNVKTRYSVIEDLSKKISTELEKLQETEREMAEARFQLNRRKKEDERYYQDEMDRIIKSEELYNLQKSHSEQIIKSLRESIDAIKKITGDGKENEKN